MKFLAIAFPLVALSDAGCVGHDHSLLKPKGPFYGIIATPNKAGDKKWNNMEVAIQFNENTFDIRWWCGFHPSLMPIPKQTFECTNVAFTFNADQLRVIVNPAADACLTRINALFPPSMGITNPFVMPVNHETGDVKFSLARGMVKVDLYATDSLPAAVPSGVEGLAPAVQRPRRGGKAAPAEPSGKAAPAPAGPSAVAPAPAASNTPVEPQSNASQEVTADQKTGTNNATARMGSVIVSAAAIIVAGLFL